MHACIHWEKMSKRKTSTDLEESKNSKKPRPDDVEEEKQEQKKTVPVLQLADVIKKQDPIAKPERWVSGNPFNYFMPGMARNDGCFVCGTPAKVGACCFFQKKTLFYRRMGRDRVSVQLFYPTMMTQVSPLAFVTCVAKQRRLLTMCGLLPKNHTVSLVAHSRQGMLNFRLLHQQQLARSRRDDPTQLWRDARSQDHIGCPLVGKGPTCTGPRSRYRRQGRLVRQFCARPPQGRAQCRRRYPQDGQAHQRVLFPSSLARL